MSPPIKDYTGRKFSRLLAVERIPERGKETRYRCICDCGKETIVKACHLTSNATKSCGCLNMDSLKSRVKVNKKPTYTPKSKRQEPIEDLSGVRFGMLVAVSFLRATTRGTDVWMCKCDCGNEIEVSGSKLQSKDKRSCGCMLNHLLTNSLPDMVGTREHRCWKSMWGRCRYESMEFHYLYKDKTPPQEWTEFANFYRDMGPAPSEKHSIDRIKNDLPYGPTNCRWATGSQQARNKSNTIMVDYAGDIMSFSDACAKAGLEYKYISGRNGHFKDMAIASNGLFTKVLP